MATNHEPMAAPMVDLTLDEVIGLPPIEDPTAKAYLNRLTNLPIDDLLTEPSALQTQSHHLTSSLTSLTHTSYPTFLSLHRATGALTDSLDSLSASLEGLVNSSLPDLEDSALSWRDKTDAVLSERRRARVVLDQHDKIRDLLDIPLLIDTCVRNGYFTEALSLASHATSVVSSYKQRGKPTPLMLTSVLSEVQNSVTQMLLTLLATLHEPSRKLPALFKAVSFLRKMNVFHEDEEGDVHAEEKIALAFLGGRESCLKSALDTCARDIERLISGATGPLDDREQEDLSKDLKKYIDTWREGVYDIISQYSTIFLERSTSSSTNPKSPAPMSPSPNSKQNFSNEPAPLANLHHLLTTYTSHALSMHLIPLLSSTLPHLTIASLPPLLTQLTYCSAAFARVGLDFRGILPSLFEASVISCIRRELGQVQTKWSSQVKSVSGPAQSTEATSTSAKRASIQSPLSPMRRRTLSQGIVTPPTKWLAPSSVLSSSATMNGDSEKPPPHVPPPTLTAYPALAELLNSLLTVLNNLRLLAPLTLLPKIQSELESFLADAGSELFTYVKLVSSEYIVLGVSGGKDKDKDGKARKAEEGSIARKAGEMYFSVFVLFMRRALVEGVYGELGQTIGDLSMEEEDGKDVGFGGHKLARLVREWEGWLSANRGKGDEKRSS